MTGLIRLWDKDFNLLQSFEGDDLSELMRQAEEFIKGSAIERAPHYTIDPNGLEGGWRNRTGGRIVCTDTGGFRWVYTREYLRRILVPDAELAKYQLDKPLGPGDKISVQIGDQLYTDTIESISTQSPKREPTPAPRRPWWRRVLRALTPRRYRRTEPTGWSSQPTTLSIVTLGERTNDETANPQPVQLTDNVDKVEVRDGFGRVVTTKFYPTR